MRIRAQLAFLALGFPLALSGCGDLLGSDEGGGPGGLEAIGPADGETAVSVLAPVMLHFSKKVSLESASAAVVLWNEGRQVEVVPELTNNGKAVVLKPVDPLDFGSPYRVEVSSLLRFRGGGNLAQSAQLGVHHRGPCPTGSRRGQPLHPSRGPLTRQHDGAMVWVLKMN